MGGGGKTTTQVNVPGPSEEELELRREQTELLRLQRAQLETVLDQQDLLKPILFEELGIEQQFDAEGNVTGFTRKDDPQQALRDEIETGFLERTRAALRGELPVNPALHRELDQGEVTLREVLRKQLGTGFETSSAGIEALARARQSKTELLEGARRGDLTMAEQLGLAREGNARQQSQFFMQNALGTAQANVPISSGFGEVASGFGQAGSAFSNDRSMQLQASINQAQINAQLAGQRSSTLSALFGAAGQGLGIAAGMGAFKSSRELKQENAPVDPEAMLEAVREMPVESWRYVDGFQDEATHIGPYAEDFQRLIGVGDGITINFIDALGVAFATIKALDAQLQELKANG